MSPQDADNSSDILSSSLEESDESRQERGVSESYFLERFDEDPAVEDSAVEDSVAENRRSNASIGTVSTAMLVEPEAVSSSREKSSSSNVYSEEKEPNIEEAMRLLKREAASANPRVSYVGISSADGFEPHAYNMPRKVSQSSIESANRGKVPRSPSLLSNILVSSPNGEGAKSIPALRSVSGSHQVLWKPRRLSIQPVVELKTESLTSPERARITKISDSQMELTIDTLRSYQRDIEATAGRGTDTHIDSIPVQHIDSSSIRSFDSKKHGFFDIYSIPRIIGVILFCIVIPPLFFMIASGEGVSNYRLMRMIMNSNHRIKLMKGFIWDIDISWFRYMCLILGVLETLGILACIGSGIGVGITREIGSHS